MRKGIIAIITGLILLVAFELYPQQLNDTPYPTLLTVKYQDGYNIINFESLKDSSYSYKLYRSTTTILKEIDLTEANLIKSISSEELPFKDIPNKDGKYYYAVILSKNGKDFVRLVPFQNTLMYPIDFSPFPSQVKITKIANTTDNEINIYINPVFKSFKYFLYTSNNKIDSLNGLKSIKEIMGKLNYFSMKIQRGKNYYFAVTAQNRLGVKNDSLSLDINATIVPFKLKELKQKPSLLKIIQKKEIKVPAPVINKNKPKVDTIISRTIKLYFVKGKYRRTIQELNWIIKIYHLTLKQKSKIYFYAGQSSFYIKNYRKALQYFILCKDYPAYDGDANAWIDRTLQKIK